MVNLYFNQLLNLDLAEQDVLSCSGAGDCDGGWAGLALDYITSTGVVDEGTFPYTATDQSCTIKGTNPSELINIGGGIPFPCCRNRRVDFAGHTAEAPGGIGGAELQRSRTAKRYGSIT